MLPFHSFSTTNKKANSRAPSSHSLHYCFTYPGSTRVGKVVAAAALKHLTPVTLELGGKSPVVVDGGKGKNLKLAARKLMWGRMLNCGQVSSKGWQLDFIIRLWASNPFTDRCGCCSNSYPSG